jgi:glycosyltransferase involved in cell wall biosynthesis
MSCVISVVVPARDAARTIGLQLDALSRQDVPVPWEVIVADNGSTDDTRALVESFARRLPVTVVDASRARTAAGTRNIGARSASGQRLLFTDADDVVDAGWLAAHAAHDYAFATGPIPRFDSNVGARWRPDQVAGAAPTLMQFLPYAPGPNFAISRLLFERAGGFDERFVAGEDVELSWRLQLDHRATLQYVTQAVVMYRRRQPSAELRQYRRYGRYDVALYRRFRDRGARPTTAREALRAYAGIAARVPMLWSPEVRSKVARQFGRRVGRMEGSVRDRVVFL